MKQTRTRRWFLTTGAAAGASAGLGTSMVAELLSPAPLLAAGHPDLAAIKGSDPHRATVAAIDAVGGMSRFVSRGSTVLINANTAFKLPGSIVDPEVLLASLEMCVDAGAAEVWLAKPGTPEYWARTPRSTASGELLKTVRVSDHDFKVVEIPGGVALKEAHIDTKALDCDVLINLSVVKNHAGTGFTGALKNAMGTSPHIPTNRFCHFGSAEPERDQFYAKVDHLSQCIADLNLVRRPDLCLVDATTYLMTNGPAGPGELRRSDTVVAATDPVAIDAYSTRFVDLEVGDVAMIGMAWRHELGEIDLEKLRIFEGKTA